MKTIFLTGSKGFIGSHLLKALNHDYSVYCAKYNELPEIYYDYIIHLAATTTTTDSFVPELFENNIIYAKQIMSIPTRIIYASSTSASELTNPYAYTKRYIEHLGQSCNSIGLRFFNVYGNGNNKGIVKKALECSHSGAMMNLYGSGNIRDFIYIDDVVEAIIDNLDNDEKIVEIGRGVGISVHLAINIIQRINGNFNINFLDGIKTDMKYSVAKKGIPNCLSFEDGIKKMLSRG